MEVDTVWKLTRYRRRVAQGVGEPAISALIPPPVLARLDGVHYDTSSIGAMWKLTRGVEVDTLACGS